MDEMQRRGPAHLKRTHYDNYGTFSAVRADLPERDVTFDYLTGSHQARGAGR